MHRLPPWIWLMLAAIFGITASLAWLRGQTQPAPVREKPAIALVAKKDIASATQLNAEMVQLTPWSRDNLPNGAFTSPTQVEGRVTAFPLVEGELILEKQLAPKGTIPGITALLPANKRAMTVKVDEASGVAGFVSPDNRVDLLVTLGKSDFNKDPLAMMLLQNIRVLGTGQRIESRPGDKPQVVPTVTLEVSPEEGERLALAAQEGRISLVLRGQEDTQVVATQGINAGNLFGSVKKVSKSDESKPAIAPRRTVEIIRGLQQEPTGF